MKKTITYHVSGISDNMYGLTTCYDVFGPMAIVWRRPFWKTPVGIISIGGSIVVLVYAMIFFVSKQG
jgi:hypothetical protein